LTTIKTLFRTAAAAAALIVMASGSVFAQAIAIGTNPQGTVFYSVGSAVGSKLTEALNRPVLAQPYAGSSVYLPLIENGELALGVSSTVDSARVYNAEGDERLGKLRSIARLWPIRIAMATRRADDIETIADLEGKRVATTLTAQAQMREIILMMLSLGGLSEDDVVASSTGNVGQALQQLTEGSIDATLTAVGIPAVQQANATISGGVRYIDLAGENTTAENMDAIVAGTFPAPLTPDSNLAEVQEDITVASWDIYLIGSADMPDEEAGAIATAVYEAWEELKSEVPALGATQPAEIAASGNAVPYHPGAIAAFQELGIWSAENDAQEASFEQ